MGVAEVGMRVKPYAALAGIGCLVAVFLWIWAWRDEAEDRGRGRRSPASPEAPAEAAASLPIEGADPQPERSASFRGQFAHEHGEVLLEVAGACISITNLQPGPFEVTYARDPARWTRAIFSAKGCCSRIYLLPLAVMDLGRVALQRAVTYGGRLVSGQGAGVAGIVVEFRGPTGELLGTSPPSAGDGGFRLDLLEPPPLDAASSSSGFFAACKVLLREAGVYVGGVPAEASGLSLEHEILVQRGSTPPRIRLLRDGKPVANALVTIHAAPGSRTAGGVGPALAEARTNAQGEASLSWPPVFPSLLLQIWDPDGGNTVAVHASRALLRAPVHELDLNRTVSLQTKVIWADDASPVAMAGLLLTGTHGLPPTEADDSWPPSPTGETVYVPGRTAADGGLRARYLPFGEAPAGSFTLCNWSVRAMGHGAPLIEVHEVEGEMWRGSELPPLAVGGVGEDRLGGWIELRDAAGLPAVPTALALSLRVGADVVHRLAFRIDPTPALDDGRPVWFVTPIGAGMEFLDGAADAATVAVTASGRAARAIAISWEELRDAWRSRAPLRLSLPPEGRPVAFRVTTPSGPASHAILSLLPLEAEPGAMESALRLTTDAAGEATVEDLDPDRRYVAFAAEPRSGGMARSDPFLPGGAEVVLSLAAPKVLLLRPRFDDGAAVAEPRAIRCTGVAQLTPRGLFREFVAKWNATGELQFPPIVPELFTFEITAFDRNQAAAFPTSPWTHRLVVRGDSIPAEMVLRMERR